MKKGLIPFSWEEVDEGDRVIMSIVDTTMAVFRVDSVLDYKRHRYIRLVDRYNNTITRGPETTHPWWELNNNIVPFTEAIYIDRRKRLQRLFNLG